VRRSQRERPGALSRLDIRKPGRFDQPGRRVTGTRAGCGNRGAGRDCVDVAVADATRRACGEVPGTGRRDTTTGFLLRARRWFRAQGIRAARVMTGRGATYRSRRFAKALRPLGIRHVFTRPYRPKTSGKAERFIQTLLRAWARGLAHPLSAAKNADLPRRLDWCNRSRPHSAFNGLPPINA
jgi:transposase InsO family protein